MRGREDAHVDRALLARAERRAPSRSRARGAAWPGAPATSRPPRRAAASRRSASTKRPARALVAPVNAPFTWPNSSLSSSASGSAAQLTATKGAAGARARRVDGAREGGLPGARLAHEEHRRRGVGHARATSKTSRIAGLAATRLPSPTRSLQRRAQRSAPRAAARASSRARSRKSASSSVAKGLVR